MRPTAVLVGAIGKLPYAGMAYYWGHYVQGLHELGYDVHYVERINHAGEAYDPRSDTMTDDPTPALAFLRGVLPSLGVPTERSSFVDLEGRCHLSGWKRLRSALARAAFVLIVADPTWFDELGVCERRGFVDGDPMFTQVRLLEADGPDRAPSHCDVLFTYGTRLGARDCRIPDTGRQWIATRPVVATAGWECKAAPPDAPIVALLHWAAGAELEYGGRTFGHKDREFMRFIDLPAHRPERFVAAVGGDGAPTHELAKAGWELSSPLAATRTPELYKAFIAGSRADLGVAKHAYVASRSGWFSDRSTCYLASGRPVLHQDTGFTDWLPTGEGVFAFSTPDDVFAALDDLDRDYDRHARAARRVAEEHFEARAVIGRMLDEAGFR